MDELFEPLCEDTAERRVARPSGALSSSPPSSTRLAAIATDRVGVDPILL